MKKLLEAILLDFKEYLLLAGFCLLSLALMANTETPALRLIRASGLELYATIERMLGLLPQYFGLAQKNAQLQRRNTELLAELSLLRTAQIENQELRALLNYKQHTAYPLKLAQIVDRTFSHERNLFTINLGSNDSVEVNMPVVTDEGLVGRVVLVSPNYAIVQPIINRDFKVGVVLEKHRAAGVLSWIPSEHLAAVEHVLLSNSVEVGERVLTAHFSSFAVPNIPVGTIVAVDKTASQLFYTIRVEPSVDFGTLEHVFCDDAPT
ncbi:MAG: rod shape-determining protein MreC [Chloroherpetonaceae bacterium]|nr:rod shape-determining protein MreC [Chloroherpetonaceae bacterium]